MLPFLIVIFDIFPCETSWTTQHSNIIIKMQRTGPAELKDPMSHKILPTMKFLPLGINAHAWLFKRNNCACAAFTLRYLKMAIQLFP